MMWRQQKKNEASFLGVDYQGIFPEECQKYRWSRFKNLGDAQEIYNLVLNEVFPFIKNLHGDGDSAYSKYMGDAIFKVPTPAMLTKLIDRIDGLELGDSRQQRRSVRISSFQSCHGRYKRPVPHTETYHKNDGGTGKTKSDRHYL